MMPTTKYPKSGNLEFKVNGLGIKSYLSNLDNAIRTLQDLNRSSGTEQVIGYFVIRGLGVREDLHRIFEKTRALELEKQKTNFGFYTIDDLIKYRENITNNPKYQISDKGRIVYTG